MAGSLTTRPMEPGDLPAVLDLMERGLGPGPAPRTAEFWRWKHERSPFGRSPCRVAVSEGAVVGMRAFLRWRWLSGARRIDSVRAVDTVTDPAFHGRGIFTRLTRELLSVVEREGAAFVFNTPNASSRPGYLKMGWRVVGRVPVQVRILRPLRLLRGLAGRPAGGPTAPNLPPVADLLAAVRRGELAAGSAGDPGDPRLRTLRSAEYLSWRYNGPPGIDYRALWRGSPGGGAGLIVRLRTRRGLREATLCELLVGSGAAELQLLTGLLRQLAETCGADYLAAAGAPGTPESRTLRRAGFLPALRLGPILTARPLPEGTGSPDPTATASWRYAIGDLELF